MAELLVIGYPDDETAQKALDTVHALEQDMIMETGGAAVVHKTDDGKVEMVTKTGATSSGVAMGGFWGLLFGLLFLVPVGGWIIGGIIGGLMGTMSGWGVKDEFRSKAADVLQPGTSAIVVFVSKATPDKAMAALAPLGGTVLRTSLSEEAEQEIQHALDAKKQDAPAADAADAAPAAEADAAPAPEVDTTA
jgi:uncharacterized membrane protein